MLAGLLFANLLAEDRPDQLVATLPFAGTTLIEHQARQLVGAGASQLVVVATQLTPGLLGALSRVGRGVTVDTVRSAAEAAEKLHPLARVLMLAEGLVATDDVISALASEGGDALLVIPLEDAPPDWERVGGRLAWAGVARLQASRVAEVARMPRDYDMQSTLLRVAEQAGAVHLVLPPEMLRHGHGLAGTERGLAERGRKVLASLMSGRRNWFDRWLVAPIAGLALPRLVERSVSGTVIAAMAGAFAVIGAIVLFYGYSIIGTVLALVGTLVATVGVTLANLRREARAERWQRIAAIGIPLGAALLLGWVRRDEVLDNAPLVAALGLIVLAILAERAIRVRESWWGSGPAYLLLIVLLTPLGFAGWGIGLAALYAAATLTAAIEQLRAQA